MGEFEKQLVDELNQIEIKGEESFDKWTNREMRIKNFLTQRDPSNFLNSDVIIESMLHTPNILELNELKGENWEFWKKGLKENWVGGQINKFPQMPETSGNLIHHAYSLKQLFNHSDINIDNINGVFEFGGGYGSFCRLMYNLGYQGEYSLFDLPIFKAIQKYFLNKNGFNNFVNEEKINFTPNKEGFENMGRYDLFVSLWALSESPSSLKNYFIEKLKGGDVKYILMAYQHKFGDEDNDSFFENLKSSDNYEWTDFNISHLPHSNYLIGVRK